MTDRWMAVTTCNREQWQAYGREMARSFVRYWPAEIGLRIYGEGLTDQDQWLSHIMELDEAAPWLLPWKAACGPSKRGVTPQGYRFRWDAVRFAHKVAAIGAAADSLAGAGVLIWVDADVITHAKVEQRWLEAIFPPTADLAWLDRQHTYPECGFMMFRMPDAKQLIADIVSTYRTGEIFDLEQWHDSYVIGAVVKRAQAAGQINVASLSGAGRAHNHVLVNSPLGTRLDHLKGDRKNLGRTPRAERLVAGGGPYWQW